ncbi:DinB superfamily protein [Muriicola jejuensis]|uniref:Putative metal-dependent hydrolase n=1 Tax=Muriicola jejuensis TaxID=504488 RepID=A0A6P0UFP6_9FLAO|nr:putative metal-dependent hydrolase [Muriicola jejuensis]NER10709.1 putative metal-dependent hydrolase [Muriicola jejuensis]SMP16637.1 DinB superfamily protein [Muriicola jejuensis]
METSELENLRYPIGHFIKPARITPLILRDWIAHIEALPVNLRDLVSAFSDSQLDTPYRPGGWTVRQVVHHLADSHHHSYIRFKWALTEEKPVIKPYLEKEWAQLADASTGPIELSLNHLEAVHAKLVYMLNGFSRDDWQKEFVHPDGNATVGLEENTGRYAWHGNHHLAHIQGLVDRMNW